MKKILSCALLLALPLTGMAGPVNIYANAHYWYTDADGSLKAPDFSGFDLQLDKGTLKGESNAFIAIAIEHPVPVLPNFRLAYSDINHQGQAAFYSSGTFQNRVSGEIDLSHFDITAYYNLPVPVITLDLGLTARTYDGYLRSDLANGNFDTTYAHIYLAGRYDIPVTGLAVGAITNAGDNGDERGVDIDAYLQYTGSMGLGVIVGYRYMDIDLESTARAGSTKVDLFAQFEVTGPYLGATYRF